VVVDRLAGQMVLLRVQVVLNVGRRELDQVDVAEVLGQVPDA